MLFVLVGVTACTPSSPARSRPPHDAGTFIVHSGPTNVKVRALGTVGPVKYVHDWRRVVRAAPALGHVMTNVEVRLVNVRTRKQTTARTDGSGIAHFNVPTGRYRASLTMPGQECDAGKDPAEVLVRRHRITRAQVLCEQP
jgi:hypothetical protein